MGQYTRASLSLSKHRAHANPPMGAARLALPLTRRACLYTLVP